MTLRYGNKEINASLCTSFRSRLIGFMGKKKIDKALIFKRCNSIHTFFMKSNIDVVMCDKSWNILYYFNDFGKNKIILPKKNVFITIEIPVNYFDIKVNNKIFIKNV